MYVTVNTKGKVGLETSSCAIFHMYLNTSTGELDDKMRWLKNYERLLEIQRNIVWPSILEMEPKVRMMKRKYPFHRNVLRI